jgi:hypothetical protein
MPDENVMPQFYQGSFPNPLLPKNIMDRPETGVAVARAIYNSCIDGENSFYYRRNSIFAQCRVFGAGKQPFQTYLDLLGVDGKQSFLNLDYHPRPVAPKFRSILVNDIMNRLETVNCTGLSLTMQERKNLKKAEAAFRMDHGDYIQAIEEQSGMKFTNPSDFTPENDDELELWSQLNDKEKEELLMEEGIEFILYNNDQNAIKKEIAEDLVDTGLGCEYTYFDGRKRIRCKRIRPEYLVYGTTNTLNFRNMPYMAHLERMSIVDVRAMFPNYPEKELYQRAYQFKGLYGNPLGLVDFVIDFETAYTRPYDSYLVDVLFYEYKVIKSIDYTKGTDKNNNPIFDLYKKTNGNNPNKKSYKITIPTIYKGAWLTGADDVMQWGEMENLIRNNEDVEDVRFSYAAYMLNNNGDMLPVSPIQSIRSSIVQMDLAILKIQHTLATTPPNGMKMDIDAITELDLGTGLKSVGPMKLREIWLQTGDTYYSGSKISGDNANRNPIEQNINQIGDKIQQYIGVYNFELGCIRDYIGINEVKDGSEVNPRLGLGVMQGQLQASNTATAHIYNGYISIRTDICKSVAIMLWDALSTDTTNDMYIKLLGKKNADFIKYNKELTKSNYLTKISTNMSQDDRVFLEKNIEVALSQGKIELEDALMVRKYAETNIEYAIRYLSFMQKKRAQMAQKQQMQLAQQQQQATAQQAQVMMAQKQQDEKDIDDREIKKVDKKGSLDMVSLKQQLINAALLENMKSGAVLPAYVQNLINEQMAAQINEQETQIEQIENALQLHDLQVTTQQIQAQEQQAMEQQQAQAAQQEQPMPEGQPMEQDMMPQ